MISLYEHQLECLSKIHTGSILCGGTGSGKSITAVAYYYLTHGGDISSVTGGEYKNMTDPVDLYIITTARKRDSQEWDDELRRFYIYPGKNTKPYKITVTVDSWNNIKKYRGVSGAFFIFDEQRVVGYGEWTKSFLDIAKKNEWILLSATPGDNWMDYIPVFIANGFYRNKSDFVSQHVVWRPRTKFPQVDRYLGTGKLLRLRNRILVDMDFERHTEQIVLDIYCDYDILEYKNLVKNRWDPVKQKPIKSASELCYMLRRVANSDPSRVDELYYIFQKRHRVIVFYNYDYERDILLGIDFGPGVVVAEWSGHKHQPVPDSDEWIYLVQYNSGAEAWNCIKTDTIVFYSQTYSYKTLIQAMGRIDRLNTPFTKLYYYNFKSRCSIDIGISRALKNKKQFNETRFMKGVTDGTKN